jgi:nucleotide-binding universal stress UspA family protein
MSAHIVCGIVGSPKAGRAAEAGRAAAVAARLGRDLRSRAVLVHVDERRAARGIRLPRPGRKRRRRRLLKDTAAAAGFARDAALALKDGDPTDGLLDAARENDAELIVVATGGAGTASPVLIGGTASALMRRTRCPVVVVPNIAVAPLDVEGMRDVVCAFEGRATDTAVLALGADLADRLGGELHVVAAPEQLTDGDLGLDLQLHPADSSIDSSVHRVADAVRAGLIVVGPPDPVPALNVPLPIALVASGETPVVVLGARAELHIGSGHYEVAAGVS